MSVPSVWISYCFPWYSTCRRQHVLLSLYLFSSIFKLTKTSVDRVWIHTFVMSILGFFFSKTSRMCFSLSFSLLRPPITGSNWNNAKCYEKTFLKSLWGRKVTKENNVDVLFCRPGFPKCSSPGNLVHSGVRSTLKVGRDRFCNFPVWSLMWEMCSLVDP